MSGVGSKPDKPAHKRTKRKRKNPARGVLWLIAILLSASGALRLSGETGQAIAREVTQIVDGESVSSEDPLRACAAESDITAVLTRLKDRENILEVRENALADRMQALAVAEVKVDEYLQALVEAENQLKSTMAIADSAAEDDLSRLTSVYENMKAKEAAALFEAMDPQFAAGFLGRMRPDAAAQIMAGLEPQTAYSISVVLAGRNANVPTN